MTKCFYMKETTLNSSYLRILKLLSNHLTIYHFKGSSKVLQHKGSKVCSAGALVMASKLPMPRAPISLRGAFMWIWKHDASFWDRCIRKYNPSRCTKPSRKVIQVSTSLALSRGPNVYSIQPYPCLPFSPHLPQSEGLQPSCPSHEGWASAWGVGEWVVTDSQNEVS